MITKIDGSENTMVNKFMLLPLWGRAAILLFLLIIVFGSIFWKVILWFLSVIPFLLRFIFRYLYLLTEIPVAALHKRFGAGFQNIDNQLSYIGERIDLVLEGWYKAWHWPKEFHFGKVLLIYILCMIAIVLPAFIKTDNNVVKVGETIYSKYEGALLLQFEKQGWYDPNKAVAVNYIEQPEDNKIEVELFETSLIVTGIRTSLLVRDAPSMTDGSILGRLQNEDTVLWHGEMCFSETDNGQIEPWVKIITVDGIEGWSRLNYLYPIEYENLEFEVYLKEEN